jgi:hypothetical protein
MAYEYSSYMMHEMEHALIEKIHYAQVYFFLT